MPHPSPAGPKNPQDSQRNQNKHLSRLACKSHRCIETCLEHQVQAGAGYAAPSRTFLNTSQTIEAASTAIGTLLSLSNTIVHDLGISNPQRQSLSPIDRVTVRGDYPKTPGALSQIDDLHNPKDLKSRDPNSDSMTPGQACLFDALLSLGHPKQECHNPSALQPQPLTQTNTISQSLEAEGDPVDDDGSEYPEASECLNNVTRPLSLDRNVESNTLPFILNAYALWAIQMMFDPLRIIQIGRRYVLWQYAASESARWKLKLVSDFAWTAGGSAAHDLDDLPSFMIFHTRMCQQFLTVACTEELRESLDQRTASDIFTFAHELFSMAFKYLPLSNILSLMQLGAPVFRRACPGPREGLVHLPSLLLQRDLSLRYYSTFDVLMSVVTNRPMFFRYDVSFTPELPESKMHIQDYFGMQWFYGVPDRLVVTLARMNALREDYGDCIGSATIRELEMEIGCFRPVLGISDDPTLTVSRLLVQECWRQAAFIYLYMGLCGANSLDARVRLAHARFMELFQGVKPGRNPDVFLIIPIVMLGIATHSTEEQDLIRRRMLNQPECSRYPTSGNDILKILNEIWARPNGSVVWYDLRLACLGVTGI